MTTTELPTDLLLGDLEAVIRDHARAAKRNQQVSIGPSEIGQECERRLALTLLGSDKINDTRDEWTSSVGTAVHSWLEAAFLAANRRLADEGLPPRWLIEQTVEVRPGLTGHTDVYDMQTATVLDHKSPGVTSIRKYKNATDPRTGARGWPGQQYQWQAHLYGMAWRRLGFPVRSVAIAMYPRSGLIRDTWLWKEPYDPAIADKALARMDALLVGMDIAEELKSLSEYLFGLHRDTSNCSWCPFFTLGPKPPADASTGCGGPFEDPGYQPTGRDMRVPGIAP